MMKDRNYGFVMISTDSDETEINKNIYRASKQMGVLLSALRNVCIKGNQIIIRRKDKKIYDITGQGKCLRCFKLTKRMLEMLRSVMELMSQGGKGMGQRIYVSACIVSYYTKYLVDYVISEDPLIGLLGLRNKM